MTYLQREDPDPQAFPPSGRRNSSLTWLFGWGSNITSTLALAATSVTQKSVTTSSKKNQNNEKCHGDVFCIGLQNSYHVDVNDSLVPNKLTERNVLRNKKEQAEVRSVFEKSSQYIIIGRVNLVIVTYITGPQEFVIHISGRRCYPWQLNRSRARSNARVQQRRFSGVDLLSFLNLIENCHRCHII
jgi:hypothetical protein